MSAPLRIVDEADVFEADIASASPEQLSTLAGWLGRMTALVQLRIAGYGRGEVPVQDRVIEVEDVARRLGQSKSWVYAHREELPFRLRGLPGNRLKFSERGLEKYLERRSG
jgi:predicted DNA-binding transcriptional regulator AlpA